MAKLTMINNVRTSRAPLMRRALLSTARTIRNIPRNLAEAGAVMMGYPMFMVTPHDEFDGWADCPSDITLTDKPTTAFFNGAGLSPVSQVLSVTDTEYSLKPETVDTLDKMVKRGQVRQALAKTLGKPVEVKGKELLAYIAYNGPFSSQQADRLNDCVNETEIHIFNRAYILLHIIHRPLRESPRNIMMVAELLKAQDWQDLAKHLLVQDSQDQQAILDYVGLHLGQEKAQELTVLMKKAPDEQFEESVEEPIAKPAEEQLSEPARQELEERLWLDVAAFAQDPAVSQSYFNPERILQECGQSGFRRGAWLANAEYSIAGLRERIAFNNKQLEGFLRLFGTLKDTRDEGKRTQLLQQIKTYQEAVDAAESGIEGFTKNLRPDSIHIQRLKSAVQEHLGAERKTLDQEHKAEMEKIKREAAGDQRFLAALRETQPRIDKITADLMDCEAELPKWLTARQALLEAGAQRLVAMPQGVAFEALAAGIDPDLLQRVDKFFEVDGIKGHTIKVRLKPEVAQNSHFSVNAIFIFSPTELLSFAQYADQDLDFASAYLLAKKDSLHDILKPNNQEIVDILSACEDIAENGIRLIPSIVHRLNILAELFYL